MVVFHSYVAVYQRVCFQEVTGRSISVAIQEVNLSEFARCSSSSSRTKKMLSSWLSDYLSSWLRPHEHLEHPGKHGCQNRWRHYSLESSFFFVESGDIPLFHGEISMLRSMRSMFAGAVYKGMARRRKGAVQPVRSLDFATTVGAMAFCAIITTLWENHRKTIEKDGKWRFTLS